MGSEVVVKALDPSIRAAAVEVIRTTPELRLRVARFVGQALDVAEEMLATAPPPTRLALVRAVLPATMRELKEEQQDSSLEEMRVLVNALHAEIRSDIEAGLDVESWEAEEVIEVDAPVRSTA